MMRRSAFIASLALLLAACGDDPVPMQYGATPDLPEPRRGLLPDMRIALPAAWENELPTVPEGYKIQAIATEMMVPRQTIVLPNGDILVAEGSGGGAPALRPKDVIANYIKGLGKTDVGGGNRLTLLRDADGDGSYEARGIFADNLNAPYGLAFVNGVIYVANQDKLVKFAYTDGQTEASGEPETVTDVGLIANLVVVLSIAVFLALDPGLYRRGLLHLIPLQRRERIEEVLDDIGTALWRWLLGQSVDMLAVAIVTGAGLWLLGIPLALALGLIAGITNFIPYVGPFIAAVPAVLIAFSQSPTDAFYTGLLFLVVQQVEGNILMPIIQDRATALPPVLAILAVVGFGVLFGLLGALFATPLLLVIMILVQKLYVEDGLGDVANAAGRSRTE